MAAKIAHRASFLQAFHTGVSETQRKANIENNTTEEITTTVPVMVTEEDTFTRKMTAGQRVGRGIVRTISDKQVKFILTLINTRDLSNLTILPGQSINPSEIPNMGVKGGTALIEKLLNCPVKATSYSVSITKQGSVKQQAFLASLMEKHNLAESDIQNYNNISEAISALLKMKSTPKANTNVVTEGMYTVGNTRIFKVQKARQSDNLYAKELIDGKFEYVAGAITIVRNSGIRMTLDEAKAYGKRTGQCCQCGRELTVKASIDAGIGPICAAKF